MKKKLIEEVDDLDLEPETTTIEKMDFEGVDMFFDGVFAAFHRDGIDGDEMTDPRFIALWTLFLASVGWTEEEFWEEQEHFNHSCPKCSEDEAKAKSLSAGKNSN